MKILAFETSCDDTSIAIFEDDKLIAIETAHADEIAQIDEVIEESQLSCAELLPAPPEEIILIDTQEEFVVIEQVIPAEIVKKVINTDSW